MSQRLDYIDAAPGAFNAVYRLETDMVRQFELDSALLHLLKLRASQINGCAYCVDMHVKEARAHGLSEQWIALVAVWREAVLFSPRERAVLAWTEAVTRLGETGVPDAVYEDAKAWFSDAELVQLTVAIGTINLWNRLAVTFRTAHPIDNAA